MPELCNGIVILMTARNNTIGIHACIIVGNVDRGAKFHKGVPYLLRILWFRGAKFPRIFGTGVP